MTATTARGDTRCTTKRRRWWPLLVIPYLLGIAWTCVHPILSIITGEAKCRGSFIDENSLDPTHFRLNPAAYSSVIHRVQEGGDEGLSLCEAVDGMKSARVLDNVECVESSNSLLQVTKIVPVSHIASTAETIAVIVPQVRNHDWHGQVFQSGLLQLVDRLASRESTPWLAKTILVVSPMFSGEDSSESLASTVDTFLDIYMGNARLGENPDALTSVLPLNMTSGMLRQLIVLDVEAVNEGDSRTGKSSFELQVLSQGRRGVLPNMDLVFVATSLFGRIPGMSVDPRRVRSDGGVLRVHSYREISERWTTLLDRYLTGTSISLFWRNWLYELGDLVLFAKGLVVGPYAPHASALERGVDALTLKLRVRIHGVQSGSRQRQQVFLDYIQTTELLLRTLSNLHERLHHSITQYLLPSPTKFVSHSEYLLPNLLLLLPLVIRAVTLLLVDIPQCDLLALRTAIGVMGLAVLMFIGSSRYTGTSTMTAVYAVAYGFQLHTKLLTPKDPQSLQFVTCLLAVYLHAPLLLGHVTLSWPSSVLWSLVLAIVPSSAASSRPLRYALLLWLVATWPPSILVPKLLGSYTPYVTLVYTPLHLLLTIQWTMKRY